MRIRKTIAALLTVLLLLSLSTAPMYSSAIVTADSGKLEALPGNTQSSSPDFSMAWLDNIVIRDSTNSFLASKIVPKPDYPYSHTYGEFIREVDKYALINDVNEETVGEAYREVADMLYYVVTALGMTDDISTMERYLSDYGIILPQELSADDTAKVAVVYAALKYNAIYVLYGKEVTLPKGISLDAAEIAILSELTGVFIPSGVDTFNGFAVQAVKSYVQDFDGIPISQNPSNAEVFHWSKVLTASSNNYQVPLTPYEQTTQAQRDYVDYAYYASIFNTIYDVQINPAKLAVADASSDSLAVQKAILTAMLDSKGAAYSTGATCEELFNLACQNGCFMLEEEFYSDVFNYDVYVASDCTRLWFTPFALASQLGGNDKNVTIYLEDKVMTPNSTSFASIDPSQFGQKVHMRVDYREGTMNDDSVTYVFNIVRTADKGTAATTDNNLVSDLQGMVNGIIPADSEKAHAIADGVFGAVGTKIEEMPTLDGSAFTANYAAEYATTYGNGYNGEADQAGNGVDFGYLGSLIDGTYASDETAVASNPLDGASKDDTQKSFVSRGVEAIKENPEIMAAPTGIIALGGLVGYFWNKKRKDSLVPEIEETTENGEDLD